MSFCTKCGKEFREGEMFCTACGTPISETVNVINPTPAEGITDNPVSVNEPEVIASIPETDISAGVQEEATINTGASGGGYFEVTDDSAELDVAPSAEFDETVAEETPAMEFTQTPEEAPAEGSAQETYDVPAYVPFETTEETSEAAADEAPAEESAQETYDVPAFVPYGVGEKTPEVTAEEATAEETPTMEFTQTPEEAPAEESAQETYDVPAFVPYGVGEEAPEVTVEEAAAEEAPAFEFTQTPEEAPAEESAQETYDVPAFVPYGVGEESSEATAEEAPAFEFTQTPEETPAEESTQETYNVPAYEPFKAAEDNFEIVTAAPAENSIETVSDAPAAGNVAFTAEAPAEQAAPGFASMPAEDPTMAVNRNVIMNAPGVQATKSCPKCGSQMARNIDFCPNCNAPVPTIVIFGRAGSPIKGKGKNKKSFGK